MKPINALPINIIKDPEIGCLEVVKEFSKYAVRFTDAWGKTWFIRTAGRDSYEWTRTLSFARTWSMETAQKHESIIREIWKSIIE